MGIDVDSAGVGAKNKLIFTSIKWRFNISFVSLNNDQKILKMVAGCP
jgi:hypothetical protein